MSATHAAAKAARRSRSTVASTVSSGDANTCTTRASGSIASVAPPPKSKPDPLVTTTTAR